MAMTTVTTVTNGHVPTTTPPPNVPPHIPSAATTPPAIAPTAIPSPPISNPKKLHGRAFYESIGSPKFVLAPMVDQSEFAWRLLSRSFLPPSSSKDLVAYTPMLHARMFNQTSKFREAHFQPLLPASTTPFLDGNPSLDRPLIAQFCANDPDELLAAATHVAPHVDAVDLNLGCPQGIARRGHFGAFLQEDQVLIHSLIHKLHTNLPVPVTAKIRMLDTKEETLAYARNVLEAGASILTIHGRTREQKGHKTGLADWSVVRYLREQLGDEVVLFANGNILRRSDIDACLLATGVDAVMSAEGNLYDPTIFSLHPESPSREFFQGNSAYTHSGWRMDAVFRRYMDIIYTYTTDSPPPTRKPLYIPSDASLPVPEDETEGPPRKKQRKDKKEKSTSPNHVAMQPHLFKLLRPLVARHHPIRDALARCRAGDIEAFEAVLQLVEQAVASAIKTYAETDGRSWVEEEQANEAKEIARVAERDRENEAKGERRIEVTESSIKTVRECRRPWWVVQPYVRPLPMEALAKGALQWSKKDLAKLAEEEKKKVVKVKVGDEVEKGPVDSKSAVDSKTAADAKPAVDDKPAVVEIPTDGLVCG